MGKDALTAKVTQGDSTSMDLRLIPEFDGTSQAVEEWLAKLELTCKLRGITELHTVVPLRLTGGAFAVYQQLTTANKEEYVKIKEALLAAFAADKFIAYEQFIARKLQDGEPVDVYLADLRRLAELFGGISDSALSCAFVAGLPEASRHILRAGSRMESLDINQLLQRARAVLANDNPEVGASTHFTCATRCTASAPTDPGSLRCLACNQPNHYARDCLAGRRGRRGGRSSVRCFACGRRGHIASMCSGNASGEVERAPASSPDRQ